MDYKKSINSSQMKKSIGQLIIYKTILFLLQFFNNFSALLLCKIYVIDFFNVIFFRFLLHHEVLKF